MRTKVGAAIAAAVRSAAHKAGARGSRLGSAVLLAAALGLSAIALAQESTSSQNSAPKQPTPNRGLKRFFTPLNRSSPAQPAQRPTKPAASAMPRVAAQAHQQPIQQPTQQPVPQTAPPAQRIAPQPAGPEDAAPVANPSRSVSVSVDNDEVRQTEGEFTLEGPPASGKLPESEMPYESFDDGFPSDHAADLAQPDAQMDVPEAAPAAAPAAAVQPAAALVPSLNISWSSPAEINVGEETDCEIVVRNNDQAAAQDVVVHSVLEGSVRYISARPEPVSVGQMISWTLGRIEPRGERRIQLRVIPENRGTFAATATVTFSSAASTRMRIEQPQLALELSAPARVIVGDPLTLVLTVTNPGSSRTSGVVVATTLPEGLETKQGREVRYEVGSLGPGESRAVEVRATAVQAGEHTVQSVASAGSRLRSAADAKIEVMQPQLELKLSGPALRYLSREALYTLHATNPGTAAAKNVRVEATIPDGLQFARAAEGGKHDSSAHTVSWFLGELSPGQSREVQLALVAVGAGSQMLRASAAAQGGLETTGEVMTQVEGISALLLEVVDTDDPVEVGAETLYEIRVTNQGSKRANNVRIVAEIPRGMQAMDYTGPVPAHVEENRIVFDVLGRLEPRADALYRVRVRGIDAGDQRFRAIMTSEMLQSPVVEEESTKVYRD